MIVTIIFVFFGFVAAIIPDKNTSSAVLNAEQMLNELRAHTYMMSADEMAAAIINNDPSYQLIDLRTPEEFKKYSLPGAINIPFRELFDEKWEAYIDQDAKKNVFYSNGTTLSSEAWMLTRQAGIKNTYVLDGGLNNWFATIIQPRAPKDTEDLEAFYLYQKRLGARQYFIGGTESHAGAAKSKAKKPVPRRKKKKMVQGGCS